MAGINWFADQFWSQPPQMWPNSQWWHEEAMSWGHRTYCIAKTLRAISIRHRSNTFVSDRCLIGIDLCYLGCFIMVTLKQLGLFFFNNNVWWSRCVQKWCLILSVFKLLAFIIMKQLWNGGVSIMHSDSHVPWSGFNMKTIFPSIGIPIVKR